MFKSLMIAAALAPPVAAAPDVHSHSAAKPAPPAKSGGCAMCAKCPMCAQMKGAKAAGQPAGRGGGGMMGGMMGSKSTSAGITLTFAPDGTAYAVRGDTIYKFDASLTVVSQVRLGAGPKAPADEHAGHQH